MPFRRETVCRRAGRSLPSPGPGAPQKQRRPYQEGPEPGSEPAPRTPSSPKPTHRLSPRPAKPKPAGAPQGARRGRREGGRRRAGSPGRSAAGAGGCPAPGAERCAAAAPPPPPARPRALPAYNVSGGWSLPRVGLRGRGRPPPPPPVRERRERDARLRLAPLRCGAWEGAGASREQRPIGGKEGGLGAGRGRPGTPRVPRPAFRPRSPAERLRAALCSPPPPPPRRGRVAAPTPPGLAPPGSALPRHPAA